MSKNTIDLDNMEARTRAAYLADERVVADIQPATILDLIARLRAAEAPAPAAEAATDADRIIEIVREWFCRSTTVDELEQAIRAALSTPQVAAEAASIDTDREFLRLLARAQGWADEQPVLDEIANELIAHINAWGARRAASAAATNPGPAKKEGA